MAVRSGKEDKKGMETSSVKSCSCPNKVQDEMYGKGRRVHNRTNKQGMGHQWRCTSCGKTGV